MTYKNKPPMKITEEIQEKINRIAAGTFLTEGTYDDLVEAADGDKEAEERVLLWQPFENDELSDVLENVENLAEDISNLIKSL